MYCLAEVKNQTYQIAVDRSIQGISRQDQRVECRPLRPGMPPPTVTKDGRLVVPWQHEIKIPNMINGGAV